MLLQFNGHSVDKGGEQCNARVSVKLLGPNVNDKTGVNIDKDKDVFETVQRRWDCEIKHIKMPAFSRTMYNLVQMPVGIEVSCTKMILVQPAPPARRHVPRVSRLQAFRN